MFGNRLLAVSLILASTAGLAAAQAATTTVLGATPSAVAGGVSIKVAATVSGATGGSITPQGMVTFHDGGTSSGYATLASSAITSPSTAGLSSVLGTIASTAQGTLASADFNADGKADVISYSSTAFQIFLNNGSSTFTALPVQTYRLTQPVFLDVNHDGKLDIVSNDDSVVDVLTNSGAGVFSAPVLIPGITPHNNYIGYASFMAIATADVSGAGTHYLLVGDHAPDGVAPQNINDVVAVYRSNTDGSFTLMGSYPVYDAGATYPNTIAGIQTADFNGDGKLDLLVAMQGRATTHQFAVVLLGYGDGTFGAATATLQPASCRATCGGLSMAPGDFNGDGKTDIVLTSGADFSSTPPGDRDVYIYAGNGDGTFASPVVGATVLAQSLGLGVDDGYFAQIAAFDIDGDGKLDFVDSMGYAYLGKGDLTFTPTTNLAGLTWTFLSAQMKGQVLLADLNADGVVDTYLSLPGSVSAKTAATPAVLFGSRNATTSLSLTSLVPGTHSMTATYAGSGTFTGSTSSAVTVTIAKQTPAITGSATPGSAPVTQPITLNVKVTAPTVMPTGTVTFTAGSTTLGTATLDASGNASISYTFSTVGTQTVTANYAGDASTVAGSVTITATTVNAFVVGTSGISTTLSASRGGTATSAIVVSSQNGFSGTVAFACSGLPTGASCAFAPASVMVSGTASGNTTMTVSVGSTVSLLRSNGHGLMLAGVGLLCVAGASRRRRVVSNTLLALAVSITMIGAAGCSSNASSTSTAKSYTFNVTATSGAAQTTSAYTLNVQ